MIRTWRAICLLVGVVAILVASIGPGAAQTDDEVAAESTVDIVGSDLSAFPTVVLGVAVTGAAARADISASDLVVTEDGAPVDITVEPLGARSLEVVLAIDVSGSMAGTPLVEAKNAAIEFLTELPESARVGLVAFGDNADLVLESTVDRNAITNAIRNLDEGGGTALYDAVTLAAAAATESTAERTAVIVLTDGADTSSDTSFDLAEDVIGRTQTDFFAVALESGGADRVALQAFADAAGGRLVAAVDPDALRAAYIDLGQRIVNQYLVSFEATSEATAADFAVALPGTEAQDSLRLALPNVVRDADGEVVAPEPPREIEQLVTQGRTTALEQPWVAYAGAGLLAVGAIVLLFVLLTSALKTAADARSLESDAMPAEGVAPAERLIGSMRDASAHLADAIVGRAHARIGIDAALDRAGIVMRAGEFVALTAFAAVLAAAALGLLLGLFGVVLGLVGAVVAAPLLLSFLVKRRNRQFADQLGDTLLMMAGALRAGFGVGQALDNVAQETDAPMSVELQRALLEIRLGRSVESALGNVAHRMDNQDFAWVVDAMRINQQVGGDLARILDQVQNTIRGRNRLRRQVAALTAEGRLSAIVLALLPVGITFVLFATNPDYLNPLIDETAGRIMLLASLASLIGGAVWLRRLIDMEI